MSSKISIKQLAKECGCSTATVSNVLNSKGFFGSKIRDKVLKAARRCNYAPNPSARGLRCGKTELVGVVFYKPNADIFISEFYLSLMRGLQRNLSESGYDMILSEYTDSMLEGGIQPSFLIKGKADGLVIFGGFPKRAVEILASVKIPTVMLDTFSENCDSITTDGARSTEAMMSKLAALGHKSAHYFAYITEDYNTDSRISGFLSGIAKYGFDRRRCILHRNFKTNDGACAELERMLRSRKKPPSALLASNDSLAHSLLEKAKSMNISIPSELSIAGFDDTAIATRCNPPLSTLHTDIEKLGEMGAQSILRRIKNPSAKIEHTFLFSEPIMRGSVSAPKTAAKAHS